MKHRTTVYLFIRNSIVRRGIKSIIGRHFNLDMETGKDLSEVFSFSDNGMLASPILIADVDVIDKRLIRLIKQVMEEMPSLRFILLLKDFDYGKMKFLFQMGIRCVLNLEIEEKDFVAEFEKVIRGERSLSPAFRDEVIRSFCEMPEPDSVQYEINDNYSCLSSELYSLTAREREVLSLIGEGKNSKEISSKLFISPYTAETHRRNILEKMHVKNTAEMVKVAVLNNLIE